MKKKKEELDVDFIGGGRPLTKEDEIAISKFIREYKAKHSSKQLPIKRTARTTARRKVAA